MTMKQQRENSAPHPTHCPPTALAKTDKNGNGPINDDFQSAREHNNNNNNYYRSDASDYSLDSDEEEYNDVGENAQKFAVNAFSASASFAKDDDDFNSANNASQEVVDQNIKQKEIQRLFNLTVRMSTQIVSGSHRRKLRNYRNCFTGRVCVQWMLANRVCASLAECVELGEKMVKRNLIAPVKRRGHGSAFANRSFLYRYNFQATNGDQASTQERFVELSVEIGKLVQELKNVQSRTEDTKSGVRFLAKETAMNMERAEMIIKAIRVQLHWARSAVVALSLGVLLMVFHQRKDLPSSLSSNQVFSDEKVGLGAIGFIVSRTLEVTAVIAVFAAIVSLFLQDGGELFSNMFSDSAELIEKQELKMTYVLNDDEDIVDHKIISGKVNGNDNATQSSPSSTIKKIERSSSVTVGSVVRRFSRPFRTSIDEQSLDDREASKTMPEDYASPPPTEEDVQCWKDNQDGFIGLRLSPLHSFQRLVGSMISDHQKETGNAPCQRPFHFESELFSGKAVWYFRDVPSTPKEIFNGKARKVQVCIQGKFKREVKIDDLMFGQYMTRSFANLPSRWLVSLALRVCRAFGAKYTMELSSPSDDRPFIRAPLILAAQTVCVSRPGEEPDVTGAAIEDTNILKYVPDNLSHSERRSFIAKMIRKIRNDNVKKEKTSARGGVDPRKDPPVDMPVFDTENVYTFCFWQAQIDFSTYIADLGVTQFDLANIVDGQPMTANCRTRDGKLAFRFEVWHKNIVAHARRLFDYSLYEKNVSLLRQK